MSAPQLVDPRQEFLAQYPTQLVDHNALSADTWAQIPMPEHGQYRTLTDVSLGIGASFYVLTRLLGNRLRTFRARDLLSQVGGDAMRAAVLSATKGYRTSWKNMVNPAVMQAFRLGTTSQLSPADELTYATVFSDQMFDYINDTSANALVAAYQDQLAKKWDPDLAWLRAVNAYGLEQRSMSQYLRMLSQGEGRDILPSTARNFVQQALQQRGQRIGLNESFRAQELGKTLVWMTQYNKGLLPIDTERRWLTAHDERVCAICGPMDRVQVPMDERFELPDGNKVWAPGVHPNCRCQVELTYPELLGKRYDANEPRDRRGRWAEVAERTQEEVVTEPQRAEPETVTAPIYQPVPEPQPEAITQPVTQAETITAPVLAPVEQPVVAKPATEAVISEPLKARTKVPPVYFLRPRFPLHVFANDLDQTLMLAGRRTWAGDHTWDVGDKIDIDKFAEKRGDGQQGVLVEAMPGNRSLAYYAKDRYADAGAFEMWNRTERDQYLEASKDFYGRAKSNANRIIKQFTPGDIRSVYEMAGDHMSLAVLPEHDLIKNLKRDVENDGELQSAYYHYLEHVRPTLVPGSQELAAMNAMMPREPHVPTVLVFSAGANGAYIDGIHRALVHGKYKVVSSKIIPAKPDLGSDAPSNIAAIKLLYLEPIGFTGGGMR